jgi:UDP-N-acetylglucosamine diphosphorylase/glucosamine-1-phosphate N-acetyltransferase
MKSDKAKVLHEVLGRPMILHVVEKALAIGPERVVVIVGHQASDVKRVVKTHFRSKRVRFALQKVRLGTGHAVLAAKRALAGFDGDVLILSGDVPMFRAETMRRAVDHHGRAGADLTVLTFRAADPAGYGRIRRGRGGRLLGNVEHRDASPEDLKIDEVNSGIYVVNKAVLFRLLSRIGRNNNQGEYYLTDIIALAAAEGLICRAERLANAEEACGINTLDDLARAEAAVSKAKSAKRRRAA